MSKTITTLQLIATRKIKQHKNPMYREKGVSLQTKPHTMTRKDFEIMAPVGSRESLAAAIKAGADFHILRHRKPEHAGAFGQYVHH